MKLLQNNCTLLKKILALFLVLFLIACKDQGCTEGDDFGEFTTQNLQFPPYAGKSNLDSNKTLCNDYNKNLFKNENIEIDLCGEGTTRKCYVNIRGDDQKCSIDFTPTCDLENYRSLHNACFNAYAKKQTSSGGASFVVARNNNDNFYLLPNADISVKIRGEITINKAASSFGKKTIAQNSSAGDNQFDINKGEISEMFLRNIGGGDFFNFSGAGVPNATTDFLGPTNAQAFKTAQTAVNNYYGSNSIQDKLKKIIVYHIPYIEGTKQTAPDISQTTGSGPWKTPDTITNQNLIIDSSTAANKRKMGVGFVLATSEDASIITVDSGSSSTLTKVDGLVEYYTTDCLSFNYSGEYIDASVIKQPSSALSGSVILKAGGVVTNAPSCTFYPMISVKQDISGFVEFDFKNTPNPTISGITVSIASEGGNFEVFQGSSITTTINIGSNTPNKIFVKKGSTLLIHTSSLSASTIKSSGLYVKTTPRPAIYCPETLFKMQRNSMCSREYSGFCKIGPELCDTIDKDGGHHKCDCASNKDFRTEWFNKFTLLTTNSYEISDGDISGTNCSEPSKLEECNACLGKLAAAPTSGGANIEKTLYQQGKSETVCFDLENYEGTISGAKLILDGITTQTAKNDIDTINNAIKEIKIAILPYFSGAGYGVLPKPSLSAFPTSPSAASANSKLQLQSTVNSSSAGKMEIYIADNADITNDSRVVSTYGFEIVANNSFTLRDGDGLKISLVKNPANESYYYNKSNCNTLIGGLGDCASDLYTLKSGNLMRNNNNYESNPINVCKKDSGVSDSANSSFRPLANAYQEIFCYAGNSQPSANPAEDINKLGEEKAKAKHVGLKFELNTDDANNGIFTKNCYYNDSNGTLTENCDKDPATTTTPDCNQMKIVNPNFTGSAPNNNIGIAPTDYFTCIASNDISKAVAGSYNITVAVKNEKDIIDYIGLILDPILDLLYSGKKDCLIPIDEKYLEGKTSYDCAILDLNCRKYTITPEFCEKNSGLCNGKTYAADHQKQDSSSLTKYCQMDIEITRNFNNKITNSEITSLNPSSCNQSQCRPVKAGEVERIYEIILNNNNFSNSVRIATVLMVMFYGISYLMGVSKLKQPEILNRIFKIGIVGLFLDPQSGWMWFNNLIIQPFNDGADYLSFLFASVLEQNDSIEITQALTNGDYSNKSLLFSTTNDIINLFLQDETWKKLGALFFFGLFGPFYAFGILYVIYMYVFVVANVVLVYVVAKLLMGVLFLVGPIFIAFFLFDKTKDYFKKWLNSILSYAFQQFFVIFALNFFNMLIYHLIKLVLGFKVCWDEVWTIDLGLMTFNLLEFWTPYNNPLPPKMGGTPSLYQAGAPSFSSILCLYVIVHIMKNFMPQIAQLANLMVDGISSATNVAGNISGAMNSMYQSAKKSFLNSYPVKTLTDGAKSIAYKGLDKAFGIGPEAERKKEAIMKKRKDLLEDRDEIMKRTNQKFEKFKEDNAVKIASGDAGFNKESLIKQKTQLLNEATKEVQIERGLKLMDMKKSQLNKLQGKEKEDLEKKAENTAKKAGFSDKEYRDTKGLKISQIRTHSSLADIAFTSFKEGSHKGGILNNTLEDKVKNISDRDAIVSQLQLSRNLKQSGLSFDPSTMTSVRNNTIFEVSQGLQDKFGAFAEKNIINPAGAFAKKNIIDPTKTVTNNLVGGAVGIVGGAVGLGAGLVGAVVGGVGVGGVGSGLFIVGRAIQKFGFKNTGESLANAGVWLAKNSFKPGAWRAKESGKHMVRSTSSLVVGGVGGFIGGVGGVVGGAIHGIAGTVFLGVRAGSKVSDSRPVSTVLGGLGGLGGLLGGPVSAVPMSFASGRSGVNLAEQLNKNLKEKGLFRMPSIAGAKNIFNTMSAERKQNQENLEAGWQGAGSALKVGWQEFKGAMTLDNAKSVATTMGLNAMETARSFKYSATESATRFADGIAGPVKTVTQAPPVALVNQLSRGYLGKASATLTKTAGGAVGGAVGFAYGLTQGAPISEASSWARSGYNQVTKLIDSLSENIIRPEDGGISSGAGERNVTQGNTPSSPFAQQSSTSDEIREQQLREYEATRAVERPVDQQTED